MYLDYDTYFEYHDQTYIIIEKVANYYGIELKELRWKHYKDYMIDVENVDIIPYSFGDVSRKIFSGNIIKFHHKCGISYNPTMVKGRQNFSILHESAHYFFDMNKECKSQSFSDLITGKGYTSEDEPKEIRANIFASLALINNEALKECLKKQMSFRQICEEFEMSAAALHVRLYDFLTKIFLLNPCLARSAINQYRYNYNSTKLISYIKMCLC